MIKIIITTLKKKLKTKYNNRKHINLSKLNKTNVNMMNSLSNPHNRHSTDKNRLKLNKTSNRLIIRKIQVNKIKTMKHKIIIKVIVLRKNKIEKSKLVKNMNKSNLCLSFKF